jgi:hypothetical protein
MVSPRRSTWIKEMNPGPLRARTGKTQSEHASPLSTHCDLERRGLAQRCPDDRCLDCAVSSARRVESRANESLRIQLRNAMGLRLKRFVAAVDVVISIILIARINDQPIRLDRRQIN